MASDVADAVLNGDEAGDGGENIPCSASSLSSVSAASRSNPINDSNDIKDTDGDANVDAKTLHAASFRR